MNDLLLRTRLEVLRGSLGQVKDVQTAIRNRAAEVEDLRYVMVKEEESIRRSLNRVIKELEFALIQLRSVHEEPEFAADAAGQASAHVGQALGRAEAIRENVKEAGHTLDRMCGRIVEAGGLDQTLANKFTKKATDWLDELEDLPPGDDQEAVRQAWTFYAERAGAAQPILTEYVHLLRGLALREMGFDAGICRIADRLLREKAGVTWTSLTVPDLDPGGALTPYARAIRLGLPEWSVWVLPLAAHEIGLVAMEQAPELEELIGREASALVEEAGDKAAEAANGDPEDDPALAAARERVRDCLADIYATFVMGPAYACATILMRLDPRPPTAGNGRLPEGPDGVPRDAERAYAVLGLLEFLGAQGKQNPYIDIVTRLREAWNSAVVQNEGVVEMDAAVRDRLDRWIEVMGADYLNQKVWSARYLPARWLEVQGWTEHLRQGGSEKIKLSDDLRDVLNAAWSCRVHHPDESRKVAIAARELCEHLLARRARGAGGRAGPDRGGRSSHYGSASRGTPRQSDPDDGSTPKEVRR